MAETSNCRFMSDEYKRKRERQERSLRQGDYTSDDGADNDVLEGRNIALHCRQHKGYSSSTKRTEWRTEFGAQSTGEMDTKTGWVGGLKREDGDLDAGAENGFIEERSMALPYHHLLKEKNINEKRERPAASAGFAHQGSSAEGAAQNETMNGVATDDRRSIRTAAGGPVAHTSTRHRSQVRPGAIRIGGGPEDDQETMIADQQEEQRSDLCPEQVQYDAQDIPVDIVQEDDELTAAVVLGGWFSLRRNRLVLLFASIVVVLVLVVGIALGVTRDGSSPAADVIIVGTRSPSSAPTSTGLRETLEEEFGPIGPRTPQEDALEWLLDSDPLQLQPNDPFLTLKERYIVAVLYFSTRGGQWTKNLGFLNGSSVCTWNDGVDDGVVCKDSAGANTVTEIKIAFNNLIGPLPLEIFNLGDLMVLRLPINGLIGPLHTEIGESRSLVEIDLSRNDFTGFVPSEVGNLRNLMSLELNSNTLTGTLPTELGLNVLLEALRLEFNELTGPLPSEIGNLRSLKSLGLSFLTGLTPPIPSEVGNLQSLTSLNLEQNKLAGSIPSEMGNLRMLTHLRLNDNELTGTVPTEIAAIPDLRTSYLEANELTGNLDPFFCERLVPIETFQADCLGLPEVREIQCSCCTRCCSKHNAFCVDA